MEFQVHVQQQVVQRMCAPLYKLEGIDLADTMQDIEQLYDTAEQVNLISACLPSKAMATSLNKSVLIIRCVSIVLLGRHTENSLSLFSIIKQLLNILHQVRRNNSL